MSDDRPKCCRSLEPLIAVDNDWWDLLRRQEDERRAYLEEHHQRIVEYATHLWQDHLMMSGPPAIGDLDARAARLLTAWHGPVDHLP